MVLLFCKLCLTSISAVHWKDHITQKQHLQQLPSKLVVKGKFDISKANEVYQYFSKFGSIRGQNVTSNNDKTTIEYRFWDARIYSEVIHQEHTLFDQNLEISWYKKGQDKGSFEYVIQNEKMCTENFVYRKLAIVNSIENLPFLEQIGHIVNVFKSLKAERDLKRKQICDHLTSLLPSKFQNNKIHFYGSSITELEILDSNLNIYLDNTDSQLSTLELLKDLISQSEHFCDTELCTDSEKIKFRHHKTQMVCYLYIKNEICVGNSELIKYYLTLNEKVHTLILLVKFWADCLNFRNGDAFSSYAICLLVIFYLQQKPYNLPSVHGLQKEEPPDEIDGWNCAFGPVEYSNSKLKETSVVDLLLEFFRFYGNFDYSNYVLSPFFGSFIDKMKMLKRDLPECFEIYLNQEREFRVNSGFCIQDPFEHSENVSYGVSLTSGGRFTDVCRKSYNLLKSKETDNLLFNLLMCTSEESVKFNLNICKDTDKEELKKLILKVLTQVLLCEVEEIKSDKNDFSFVCEGQYNIWYNRIDHVKSLPAGLLDELDKEIKLTSLLVQNSTQKFVWKIIFEIKFDSSNSVELIFKQVEELPVLAHLGHLCYVTIVKISGFDERSEDPNIIVIDLDDESEEIILIDSDDENETQTKVGNVCEQKTDQVKVIECKTDSLEPIITENTACKKEKDVELSTETLADVPNVENLLQPEPIISENFVCKPEQNDVEMSTDSIKTATDGLNIENSTQPERIINENVVCKTEQNDVEKTTELIETATDTPNVENLSQPELTISENFVCKTEQNDVEILIDLTETATGAPNVEYLSQSAPIMSKNFVIKKEPNGVEISSNSVEALTHSSDVENLSQSDNLAQYDFFLISGSGQKLSISENFVCKTEKDVVELLTRSKEISTDLPLAELERDEAIETDGDIEPPSSLHEYYTWRLDKCLNNLQNNNNSDEIVKDLELICKSRVILYGSRALKVELLNSDLNVYLKTDTNVYDVYDSLSESDTFSEVSLTSNVVKCVHSMTKVICEIFTSETHLITSKLIQTYLNIDDKVVNFVAAVKIWSKQFCPTLSSYSLYLFVIFYLQQKPYNLPTIEEIQKGKNVSSNEALRSATVRNLMSGFFQFYGEFDFFSLMISPFLGRCIPKVTIANFPTNSALCLQDPFKLSHNVLEGISLINSGKFTYFCRSATKLVDLDARNFLQSTNTEIFFELVGNGDLSEQEWRYKVEFILLRICKDVFCGVCDSGYIDGSLAYKCRMSNRFWENRINIWKRLEPYNLNDLTNEESISKSAIKNRNVNTDFIIQLTLTSSSARFKMTPNYYHLLHYLYLKIHKYLDDESIIERSQQEKIILLSKEEEKVSVVDQRNNESVFRITGKFPGPTLSKNLTALRRYLQKSPDNNITSFHIFDDIFPISKVFFFGSRVTKLFFQDSDLNIYIDHCNLQSVADAVSYNSKFNKLTIDTAGGIHWTHAETSVKCRVTTDKSHYISHKLIDYYLKLGNNVHEFMFTIKAWIRRTHQLEFPSYGVYLLVIFFLQQEPFKAPPMSRLLKNGEFNFVKYRNVMLLQKLTFVEILLKFLKFYSDFDYVGQIISPFLGQAIEKSSEMGVSLYVQDPLNKDVNVIDGIPEKFISLCKIFSPLLFQQPDKKFLKVLFTIQSEVTVVVEKIEDVSVNFWKRQICSKIIQNFENVEVSVDGNRVFFIMSGIKCKLTFEEESSMSVVLCSPETGHLDYHILNVLHRILSNSEYVKIPREPKLSIVDALAKLDGEFAQEIDLFCQELQLVEDTNRDKVLRDLSFTISQWNFELYDVNMSGLNNVSDVDILILNPTEEKLLEVIMKSFIEGKHFTYAHIPQNSGYLKCKHRETHLSVRVATKLELITRKKLIRNYLGKFDYLKTMLTVVEFWVLCYNLEDLFINDVIYLLVIVYLVKEKVSQNWTVLQLLTGFFRFYSNFDYFSFGISLHFNSFIEKTTDDLLMIQDSENLWGGFADNVPKFILLCQSASRLITSGGNNLLLRLLTTCGDSTFYIANFKNKKSVEISITKILDEIFCCEDIELTTCEIEFSLKCKGKYDILQNRTRVQKLLPSYNSDFKKDSLTSKIIVDQFPSFKSWSFDLNLIFDEDLNRIKIVLPEGEEYNCDKNMAYYFCTKLAQFISTDLMQDSGEEKMDVLNRLKNFPTLNEQLNFLKSELIMDRNHAEQEFNIIKNDLNVLLTDESISVNLNPVGIFVKKTIDIDLFFSKDEGTNELQSKITTLLSGSENFDRVFSFPGTLKFRHKKSQLCCNLHIRDESSQVESKIEDFLSIDEKIPVLVAFIKFWADCYYLHDLSTYAICMLVIFYLQYESPKNENFQHLLEKFFKFYANYDYTYYAVVPEFGSSIEKIHFLKPHKAPQKYRDYIFSQRNKFLTLDCSLYVLDLCSFSRIVTPPLSLETSGKFTNLCRSSALLIKNTQKDTEMLHKLLTEAGNNLGKIYFEKNYYQWAQLLETMLRQVLQCQVKVSSLSLNEFLFECEGFDNVWKDRLSQQKGLFKRLPEGVEREAYVTLNVIALHQEKFSYKYTLKLVINPQDVEISIVNTENYPFALHTLHFLHIQLSKACQIVLLDVSDTRETHLQDKLLETNGDSLTNTSQTTETEAVKVDKSTSFRKSRKKKLGKFRVMTRECCREFTSRVIESLKGIPSFTEQLTIIQAKLHLSECQISKNLTCIAKDLPFTKVEFFGSVVTHSYRHIANVDVHIIDENLPPVAKLKQLKLLKDKFSPKKFSCFCIKSSNKIEHSVIQVCHKETRMFLEIIIDNEMAIKTTEVIKYYTNVDVKIKMLMVFVKVWADCYKLNKNGLFYSYILNLMVIFYFQQEPYKLPPIYQLLQSDNFGTFPNALRYVAIFDIFKGFFKFYGTFDYFSNVVCPFFGSTIAKTRFLPPYILPKVYNDYVNENQPLKVDTGICVQDPLVHSKNVTSHIQTADLDKFTALCRCAYKIMEHETLAPLYHLLSSCQNNSVVNFSEFYIEKPEKIPEDEWRKFSESRISLILSRVLRCTYENRVKNEFVCQGNFNIMNKRTTTLKQLLVNYSINTPEIVKETAVSEEISKKIKSNKINMIFTLNVDIDSTKIVCRLDGKTDTFACIHFLYTKLLKLLSLEEYRKLYKEKVFSSSGDQIATTHVKQVITSEAVVGESYKIMVKDISKNEEKEVNEYFMTFGPTKNVKITTNKDESSVTINYRDAQVYCDVIQKQHFICGRKVKLIPLAPLLGKIPEEEFEDFKLSVIHKTLEGESFEQQLAALESKLKINPHIQKQNYHLIEIDLESAIMTQFKIFKIYFFGLDLYESNLGIFVDYVTENTQLVALTKIKTALQGTANFSNFRMIPTDIPLFTCKHIKTNTTLEINVRNVLCVKSNSLLKNYFKFDGKIHTLIILIKFWNECYNLLGLEGFSMEMLCLLVIFFLQQEPYKLPTVFDLQNGNKYVVDGWNCAYNEFFNFSSPSLQNTSVKQLLTGFFQFYSQFDYVSNVISVFLGQAVEKINFLKPCHLSECYEEYVKRKEYISLNCGLSIQDSFEHTKNLSQSVSLNSIGKFTCLCRSALRIMQSEEHQQLYRLFFYCDIKEYTEFPSFILDKNDPTRNLQDWKQAITNYTEKFISDILKCKLSNIATFGVSQSATYACVGQYNIWNNRIEAWKMLKDTYFDSTDREVAITTAVTANHKPNSSWNLIIELNFIRTSNGAVKVSFLNKGGTLDIYYLCHFFYTKLMTYLESEASSNKILDDINDFLEGETKTDTESHVPDTTSQSSSDVQKTAKRKRQSTEDEDDIPPDFFDDFTKEDFLEGLNITDAWDEENTTKEIESRSTSPSESQCTHSSKDGTNEKKVEKKRPRSRSRSKRLCQSKSKSRTQSESKSTHLTEVTNNEKKEDKRHPNSRSTSRTFSESQSTRSIKDKRRSRSRSRSKRQVRTSVSLRTKSPQSSTKRARSRSRSHSPCRKSRPHRKSFLEEIREKLSAMEKSTPSPPPPSVAVPLYSYQLCNIPVGFNYYLPPPPLPLQRPDDEDKNLSSAKNKVISRCQSMINSLTIKPTFTVTPPTHGPHVDKHSSPLRKVRFNFTTPRETNGEGDAFTRVLDEILGKFGFLNNSIKDDTDLDDIVGLVTKIVGCRANLKKETNLNILKFVLLGKKSSLLDDFEVNVKSTSVETAGRTVF